MRSTLDTCCDDCPPIGPFAIFACSSIDHWLDSEAVSSFHYARRSIRPVVQNFGRTMKQLANAVAAILAYNSLEAISTGNFVDSFPYFTKPLSWFAYLDCRKHGIVGGLNQILEKQVKTKPYTSEMHKS